MLRLASIPCSLIKCLLEYTSLLYGKKGHARKIEQAIGLNLHHQDKGHISIYALSYVNLIDLETSSNSKKVASSYAHELNQAKFGPVS